MESEPITEDDLDDLREWMDPSGNCLVCLNPCKSWSNDLFLYTCTCIYRVHPDCFKEWRIKTKTNRVCLICGDEFDTFGYAVEEEPEPDAAATATATVATIVNTVARFHPGIETEMEEAAGRICCIEKIYKCFVMAILFSCIIIIMNIFLSIANAFRPLP